MLGGVYFLYMGVYFLYMFLVSNCLLTYVYEFFIDICLYCVLFEIKILFCTCTCFSFQGKSLFLLVGACGVV